MYNRIIIVLALFLLLLPAQQVTAQSSDVTGYDRSWEVKPGYFKVRKGVYFGITTKEGVVIVPCEYNQIWDLNENNILKVIKGGKIGLFNINGVEIAPAQYDQIYSFENRRARVLKNGKVGYIDMAGREIIKPQYNQIWDFENERARVLKDGKIGYIDTAGHEVIPPRYDQIWDFENERARVLKDGKIGYIDPAGHEVIPAEYNQIWEFENGEAKALLNGKIVWIDSRGEIIRTSPETYQETVVEVLPQEVVPGLNMNDSIFNDSTVVRIWSDRVEIVTKTNTGSTNRQTSVEYRKPNRNRRRRFVGHWAGMNVGYNNLMTSSQSFNYPDEYMFMEMNAGKSVGVAINPWQQSIKLQRRGNIGLVTGLGVEWNNYRFDSQYLLNRDEEGNTSYIVLTDPVKKNKLTTVYMNAPLLLEFQVPVGRDRSPIYISAGAIGGLRLGSHTKVVYAGDSKAKNKDHYNLTQWRYGVTARMGYKDINIFADYYFSPLFEKSKDPDLYQVSAGLFIYLDY